MMRWFRLALSLLFFVPVFVVFGYEGWGGRWPGVVAGGAVGVFFGLVFGGNPDLKVWDRIFGPKEAGEDKPERPA